MDLQKTLATQQFVTLKNVKTGATKRQKVGWSWTIFFFGGVFGIPLFIRGLNVWGGVAVTMQVIAALTPMDARNPLPAIAGIAVLVLIELGIMIWLAIKGNRMAIEKMLEGNWQIVT
jgi:hypothetical protein